MAAADAVITYLGSVEKALDDEQYDKFFDILEDFKAHRNDTIRVLEKLQLLFKDNDKLTLGFIAAFFPRYHMRLPDDKEEKQKPAFADEQKPVYQIWLGYSVLVENYHELINLVPNASERTLPSDRCLFKLGDYIYELDMILGVFNETIKGVERLMAAPSGVPLPAVDQIPASSLRLFELFYGDRGLHFLEVVRSHPRIGLPILWRRLQQKQEELARVSSYFREAWDLIA